MLLWMKCIQLYQCIILILKVFFIFSFFYNILFMLQHYPTWHLIADCWNGKVIIIFLPQDPNIVSCSTDYKDWYIYIYIYNWLTPVKIL